MIIRAFVVEQLENIIEALQYKVDSINIPTVINNLYSISTTDSLSAYQGKILKDLLDTKLDANLLPEIADNLTTVNPSMVLSAYQGKVLKDMIDSLTVTAGNVKVIDNYGGGTDRNYHALSAYRGKELYDDLQLKAYKTELPIISDDYRIADRSNILTCGTILEALSLKLDKTSIADDLETTDINKVLSAAQGKILVEMIGEKANKSDLPTVSNNYNAANDTDLLTATAIKSKINELNNSMTSLITPLYDGLDSQSVTSALTARQGYVLNDLISNCIKYSDIYDKLDSTNNSLVLSAKQGSILNDRITSVRDELLQTMPVIPDIIDTFDQYNTDKTLSANAGRVLYNLINDTKSDIVNNIISIVTHDINSTTDQDRTVPSLKLLKEELDKKINIADSTVIKDTHIVDDLLTDDNTKVLSARQGYILNNIIKKAYTLDFQTDIYVDNDNGNDDNNGGIADPVRTIQRAINIIPKNVGEDTTNGVTIHLLPDNTTFNLSNPIIVYNFPWIKRLTIIGTNITINISTTNENALYNMGRAPLIINNCIFNISSLPLNGKAIYTDYDTHLHLNNCTVKLNNDVDSIIYGDYGSRIDIDECVIEGLSISTPYGVTYNRSTGTIIRTSIRNCLYGYNFLYSTIIVNDNTIDNGYSNWNTIDSARMAG